MALRIAHYSSGRWSVVSGDAWMKERRGRLQLGDLKLRIVGPNPISNGSEVKADG